MTDRIEENTLLNGTQLLDALCASPTAVRLAVWMYVAHRERGCSYEEIISEFNHSTLAGARSQVRKAKLFGLVKVVQTGIGRGAKARIYLANGVASALDHVKAWRNVHASN